MSVRVFGLKLGHRSQFSQRGGPPPSGPQRQTQTSMRGCKLWLRVHSFAKNRFGPRGVVSSEELKALRDKFRSLT